jgi:hypothetical protein
MHRFLADPAIPEDQRVRTACSIGAVMSTVLGADEVFEDVPTAELGQYLRRAVRDLIGPPAANPTS